MTRIWQFLQERRPDCPAAQPGSGSLRQEVNQREQVGIRIELEHALQHPLGAAIDPDAITDYRNPHVYP
jgi:hypothetical protein